MGTCGVLDVVESTNGLEMPNAAYSTNCKVVNLGLPLFGEEVKEKSCTLSVRRFEVS